MMFALVFFFAFAWADYCPSASDLQVAYTDNSTAHAPPIIVDGGWTTQGGGGVCTKATFNLLGGWVAYNMDVANVPSGVNANIYCISPKIANEATGYNPKNEYCDGNNANYCPEGDFIESNGNCGGATTLHTVPGTGPSNNCNGWGCGVDYKYSSTSDATFSMNISFTSGGVWTVTRNGRSVGSLNPPPQQLDWDNLANAFRNQGALIYSSQWVGWVPGIDGCGTANGNLTNAKMIISNLRISGTKLHGPTPRSC